MELQKAEGCFYFGNSLLQERAQLPAMFQEPAILPGTSGQVRIDHPPHVVLGGLRRPDV